MSTIESSSWRASSGVPARQWGEREGSAAGSPFAPARLLAQARATLEQLQGQPVVPFASAQEHLRAELEWVRRLLARLVYVRYAEGALDTHGLSVPHREIASYLGWVEPSAEPLPVLDGAIGLARELLDQRIKASLACGVELRLAALADSWGLDSLELQLVGILLAPELDPLCGRAYRYAWNDFQRQLPTIGFCSELLAAGDEERARAAVHRLLPASRLLRARLVVPGRSGQLEEPALLQRPVQLATRVVLHIMGLDDPDERLAEVCHLQQPDRPLEELVLPAQVVDRACSLLLNGQSPQGLARLMLLGPPGTGKKTLSAALGREIDRKLLVADLGRLWEQPEQLAEQVRRILREATLQAALCYLDLSRGVPLDGVPWWIAASIADAVNEHPGRVIVGCGQRLPWLARRVHGLQELTLPFPDAEDRLRLWSCHLPQRSYLSRSVSLQDVARQYALSGGAIRSAAATALERARRRSRARPRISSEDLHRACSGQVQHRLSTLAQRISVGFTWSDMVLEQDTQELLQQLLAFARHKHLVFHDWGFSTKLPYGGGLSALLSGPPGTGKTMAAGIIARELGMELFRIDLSRVVDKYIGETEKNLGRIFDEARESNAVLLFDEADSLFSKRTDVRSSVDRYANLEVNYLLQRMEDHDGVTLLTTNMEASLDEAFKRRLKFCIPFHFPGAEARARLWRSMIPAQAALADDVEWSKLGATFEMSGGHIKNAALRAAVLAADAGGPIRAEHLHRAATLEYSEMGKLVISP